MVTDAFWGDKAKFSSVEKVVSKGRTAYQLTLNPDDVSLRLISFLDPTSIGSIHFNPDALPGGIIGDISVSTSYGVLKGAPAASPPCSRPEPSTARTGPSCPSS